MSGQIPEIDEPVELVEYDPNWPGLFAEERQRVLECLRGLDARIEHFGSTAVPGMAGKPIVDLLVGVAAFPLSAPATASLESIGYENFGEIFIPGRWYLRKRGPPHFNIAATAEGGEFWRAQLLIRDYLRANPDEAVAYAEAKRSALATGMRMFSSYSQGKAPFLEGLRRRAEQWQRIRSVG